jgi:LmbE family N-acetylglucosaminyl deacetylase
MTTDLSARLGLPPDRAPICLAIGAHPDDIEIGTAGTLLRLAGERPDLRIGWIVLSGSGERAVEARRSARSLLGDDASLDVRILSGRDGYLPYAEAGPIKEALAELQQPTPDLVLVHRRDDAHQDHRFAADLAWQIFRWSTILEYEIPKWDGDVGPMNLYVALHGTIAERKVNHLLTAFPSQAKRDWYSADTFRAVMRLRGMESRAPSGMAEAFLARKLIV